MLSIYIISMCVYMDIKDDIWIYILFGITYAYIGCKNIYDYIIN